MEWTVKGTADDCLGGAVGTVVGGALLRGEGDTALRAWVRWIG